MSKFNKLQKFLEPRKESSVEKTQEDLYRDIAQNFPHYSSEDIASIGGLESQHGKYEKPLQGGSARGTFQFQPTTAEHLIPGSSKDLLDKDVQSALMTKYLDQHDTDTIEDAYIKHNLGPGRGERFLNAPDNALVSSVIPARVIRSNPGLYNVKTVGEARAKINKKLKEGKESVDIKPSFLDLLKESK